MRRIVSWETPEAAATVRSGSFCSTTRCRTVGHSEAGRPSAGRFGPGRRCLITAGGGLPSADSSEASQVLDLLIQCARRGQEEGKNW
jgi:hypothetical protein